jgi:CheY-like chemotaxis protein
MSGSILVVDDDTDAREVLVEALAEDYGPVLAATNGKEALDLIRGDGPRPDVIVLDLRMPVMDGVSFLQHRAIDPHLSSVPVIVLTGEVSLLPELAGTVDALLPKPVPLRRLREIIDVLCDESSTEQTRARSIRHMGRASSRPSGNERRHGSVAFDALPEIE